jgi:hypothetical protein
MARERPCNELLKVINFASSDNMSAERPDEVPADLLTSTLSYGLLLGNQWPSVNLC